MNVFSGKCMIQFTILDFFFTRLYSRKISAKDLSTLNSLLLHFWRLKYYDVLGDFQVTSNWESLSKHCYHYGDSPSSHVDNSVCLRLNNLSLSRIGSTEKLLWIQMLDLSHNELRSIEGTLLRA